MDGAERFVRIGLAADLVTIAGVIPLIVGLYVVSEAGGRGSGPARAVLAADRKLHPRHARFRHLHGIDSGSGDGFMAAAERPQTDALVYALLRVHSWGFQFGFLFLGLGQILVQLALVEVALRPALAGRASASFASCC